MPHEHPNRALMRRVWEASARGDADAVSAGYAPDAVLRAHGGPMNQRAGEYKGIDEILGYLASSGETVDDLRSEVLEIYTSGHGAVVRYRVVATRGGMHLDMQYLYIAVIEAERIVRATLVPMDQRRNDEFWRTQ
jgi:ketosteroid isomerase-like protein